MATLTSSVRKLASAAKATSALLGCALGLSTAACAGIDAGVEYPEDMPSIDPNVSTPEGEEDPSVSLVELKIRKDACKNVDTSPVIRPLTPDDLTRFFEEQGVKITPKKARGNLYWYDFPNGSEDKGFVRLRLAVLENSGAAAKDLQASLHEHGPGWWGVRRSNLAVLAPKASLREGLEFAIKTKLACWGIFTYAGLDDAYVVPGPYSEL